MSEENIVDLMVIRCKHILDLKRFYGLTGNLINIIFLKQHGQVLHRLACVTQTMEDSLVRNRVA